MKTRLYLKPYQGFLALAAAPFALTALGKIQYLLLLYWLELWGFDASGLEGAAGLANLAAGIAWFVVGFIAIVEGVITFKPKPVAP